jgi:hypothetical protein
MPKIKPLKHAHTSNSQVGMGNYYGTGVKNPVAKSKEIMGTKGLTSKSLKKPPKSLA